MATARFEHSATLLQDGRVLVAGGEGGTKFLSSAELYDPSTNSWSSADSMAAARSQHSAILLQDGRVLVTGGYNGNYELLSSAELYDPATNSWSPAAPLTIARYDHSATLLPDGRVLVAGGCNYTLSFMFPVDVELYEPATNSWSAASSMVQGRIGHSATLLPDGNVLVAGGFGGEWVHGYSYFSNSELYDTATNTWSAAGSLATARGNHSAILLTDGSVLVAGGRNEYAPAILSSSELYDPATKSWSATGSLATARFGHSATLLPDGSVLVAGGVSGLVDTPFLASAELYEPAIKSWSAAGTMTDYRWAHSAILLPDGSVLVAGGDHGAVLNSAELYGTAARFPWPMFLPAISGRSRL